MNSKNFSNYNNRKKVDLKKVNRALGTCGAITKDITLKPLKGVEKGVKAEKVHKEIVTEISINLAET